MNIAKITKAYAKKRINTFMQGFNKADGALWYSEMSSQISDMAERCGVSFNIACAVIAALSPGMRWDGNIEEAELLINAYRTGELSSKVKSYNAVSGQYRPTGDAKALHSKLSNGRKLTGYGFSILKAYRILETGDVTILNGPKITAFYNNLLGNSDYVTIDFHIANFLSNNVYTAKGLPTISPKVYRKLSDAIKEASKDYGMRPMDLQACIWVHQRKVSKGHKALRAKKKVVSENTLTP